MKKYLQTLSSFFPCIAETRLLIVDESGVLEGGVEGGNEVKVSGMANCIEPSAEITALCWCAGLLAGVRGAAACSLPGTSTLADHCTSPVGGYFRGGVVLFSP